MNGHPFREIEVKDAAIEDNWQVPDSCSLFQASAIDRGFAVSPRVLGSVST